MNEAQLLCPGGRRPSLISNDHHHLVGSCSLKMKIRPAQIGVLVVGLFFWALFFINIAHNLTAYWRLSEIGRFQDSPPRHEAVVRNDDYIYRRSRQLPQGRGRISR